MDNSRSTNFNLEDIARLSGVSRSTVSRVINGHPNVSDRTRERVLEIIEKYNFQPNTIARALASNRSKVIGILIPHLIADIFSDPFFPVLLQSITNHANQLDYGVTLWLTSQDNSTRILNRLLNDRLIDGLIVAEASVDRRFLISLNQRNKPFLIIGRTDKSESAVNFVDVENRHGGWLMTQHLISRGRQRIGLIPGRPEIPSSVDRQDGYTSALNEAGLPTTIAPTGHFTEAGGYRSMQFLLERGVDAVFCASDMMALGAMTAIRETGLRIPDDIAVGGFDDISMAANAAPPLTTIRQRIDLSGETAAAGIISILEGDHLGLFQRVLPVELVVREST